jgi:hypothetical protein
MFFKDKAIADYEFEAEKVTLQIEPKFKAEDIFLTKTELEDMLDEMENR